VKLHFAGRRELEGQAQYANVHGGMLDASNPRAGVEDDGNISWPERVAEAARLWPQADASDFEPLDRNGRRWRDLGSGTEYRALSGAPLLSSGEATRGASCFLVRDNRIFVLRRADYQEELRGPVSHVYGQQLSASSPGPDLRVS
jgi:hypothetical protein